MADRQHPSLRWRWVAAITAVVLAVAGVGFLVMSVQQHTDAQDDLKHARQQLVTAQRSSSSDARQLSKAQFVMLSVRDQLAALQQGVGGLADLDQQDLTAVKTAIQAGVGGDLSGYNAAVDSRHALDPQHDAAVEQLRQQANAVITALNALG